MNIFSNKLSTKKTFLSNLVACDFTTSNYWILPAEFRSTNNATYTIRFNSGSLPVGEKSSNILCAQTLFTLLITPGGYMLLWNWESESEEHNFDIASNTNYTATVYLNGINRTYTLLNEDTGVIQTHSFTDTAGQAHPSNYNYIVVGNHSSVIESWAGPFLGDIYLKQFTINIDGTEVFNSDLLLKDKFNIYSRFFDTRYLILPNSSLNFNNEDDVTYIIKFKTPNGSYAGLQQIFDFGDSYQLYISQPFNLNFWNNYTQEDINILTWNINTIYWVKFRRYQGTTYVSYSTDGINYSEPITSYDPYVQETIPSNGWIARFRTTSTPSRYFRGTIYFNDFKQIINGVTTINGANLNEGIEYAAVGDLDRFNTAGIQKFGLGPRIIEKYIDL